jgi:epoxyqueuosine reductase
MTNMEQFKNDLRQLAIMRGAIDARVADLNMMAGPPSADPTFILPEARSVIAFAVPLGQYFIEEYLGKKTRRIFGDIMFDRYQKLALIADELMAKCRAAGFKAAAPDPNADYRPAPEGSPRGHLFPKLSFRYAAVASGLGTFGWSGNVMIEGHWSTVFLGGVVTDAELPPDSPKEESLCDGCRLCAQVCPLEYIQPKENQTVNLGGREYTYNAKGNHMRCGFSCGGMFGDSRNGKWSSWATQHYEWPDKDEKLFELAGKSLQDPDFEPVRRHISFANMGRVTARSREDTHPTCCHCIMVCSGPRERRKYLRDLLHSAGLVVRDLDGSERGVKAEDLSRVQQEIAGARKAASSKEIK